MDEVIYTGSSEQFLCEGRFSEVKLSIVILCWNDRQVILDCLGSIYETTRSTEFEVIVCDNASTDDSPAAIRARYPEAEVIENSSNLRFAKGNNVGIRRCRGKYILILNPDTLIHPGTLDGIVALAESQPEIAAFGCRVLNADGSYQESARPFASVRGEWISAFYARWLGRCSEFFKSDTYAGWKGNSERLVDWVMGCFMLIRADLLKQLNGFDEQFFYYYEDMDLCRRIWQSGNKILFSPKFTITHLKGHSTSQRLPPIGFALDSQITRYRYYYKYEGREGVMRARQVAIARGALRILGYGLSQAIRPAESKRRRVESFRLLLRWHWLVDPVRLVEKGEEPPVAAIAGRVVER